MIARVLSFLCTAFAVWSAQAAGPIPETRPFHLGFTRWLADLTLEGVRTAVDFAHEHGDCFCDVRRRCPVVGGTRGQAILKDVNDKFKDLAPVGKKLFLSISPLAQMDRKTLAPYWGERDNLPLPKPWDQLAFNSPGGKVGFFSTSRYGPSKR